MPIATTSVTRSIPVASAAVDERVGFIRRTYFHLTMAVLAFIAVETSFFATGIAETLTRTLLATKYSWLIVLGAFMAVGWVANRWAESSAAPSVQYAGLTLYVFAEAVIMAPLLFIATLAAPGAIQQAALITFAVFVGLTAIVFVSKKDFSFLGTGLAVLSMVALGVIVAGIVFGFNLGLVFSALMIGLASGYIVYYTSNVMHHYHSSQHVAASLALFAAVALLFWYVLHFLMSLRD